MIRVLLVEDSITQREILRRLLNEDPDFSIIGEARNGREAIEMVERLRPDVVLMDIHMPQLDGVEATRQIMQRAPTPIVIASATLQSDAVDLGLEALKAGAVSVITKPEGAVLLHLNKIAPELRQELLAASKAKLARGPKSRPETPPGQQAQLPLRQIEVVAICASTGGPPVLVEILSKIPRPYPLPILLVQHIAAGFVSGFARWLQELTGQQVALASPWQMLSPGVWLSPGELHLTLGNNRRIQLLPSRGEIHCPSADILLQSLAERAGATALGIILTGMGDDGAAGLLALRKAGGRTIVQNEASSLIFGMPKAARNRNAAERELPPEAIIDVLTEVAQFASGPPP